MPKLQNSTSHLDSWFTIHNAAFNGKYDILLEELNNGVVIVYAIKDNKIIAVAGCHPLPEVSPNAWRIMFRGCELPQTDTFKGLGKGDWNSITQREMIPKFIEWCPSDQLYITTNTHHDHSNGKSSRNHRLMGLLAKQKILDKHSEIVLYYTEQTVWKLNIKEYTRRRSLLKGNYVV